MIIPVAAGSSGHDHAVAAGLSCHALGGGGFIPPRSSLSRRVHPATIKRRYFRWPLFDLVVDSLGDFRLADVGGQVTRLVVAHPLLDVVDQAVLGAQAEEFAAACAPYFESLLIFHVGLGC